jgi:hypothetical protein
MKTMTCSQLGGACDKAFHANSFAEMAELSQQHGKEMFQQKDEAHLNAMQAMGELMKEPEAMQQWFAARQAEFDALPED